MPDDVILAK